MLPDRCQRHPYIESVQDGGEEREEQGGKDEDTLENTGDGEWGYRKLATIHLVYVFMQNNRNGVLMRYEEYYIQTVTAYNFIPCFGNPQQLLQGVVSL